ncbi:helix-turn-helix domain-containing protein [Natronorubrum thiooxidans]|uniref:Predicted DNA binding protein, contains HTH domain n=1 Tax=Natronorubrum thiooxidans TaxID=308853 RepID=A0A1N7GL13_9EURY|nr:helix-turn-helix domain-containing protein [Natronorubrum thiooxidans]SIS13283.1 Predicted DNA binding protein, contains HTH domain [Natronorubrum thiooxidans]
MSITVKAYIEHDELALVPTLRSAEEIRIEVTTQANTDPDSDRFPFRIEYDDFDELEGFLEQDPTVHRYELVDASAEMRIYYIEHSEETILLSPIVTSVNGFMSCAESKCRGWFVQLQLPDREALNGVWEYTKKHDMDFNIIEVYGNTGSEMNPSFGLTDEQLEALTTAYRCGYFCEPREMSLDDVAAEVGISSTAMSGRLRRGMQNLISGTVVDDETLEKINN